MWTPPDAANSPQGMAYPIRPDGQAGVSGLRGPNAYGQVAGEANERPFLWAPNQPQGTTGMVTWLNDELEYVADLNDFGQVAGFVSDEQSVPLWTPTQAHATTGQITRSPKPGVTTSASFN
jgi:hypothetical protein